eukprot:Platyproteum_vivax@DN6251_c0_g1_i1.p1
MVFSYFYGLIVFFSCQAAFSEASVPAVVGKVYFPFSSSSGGPNGEQVADAHVGDLIGASMGFEPRWHLPKVLNSVASKFSVLNMPKSSVLIFLEGVESGDSNYSKNSHVTLSSNQCTNPTCVLAAILSRSESLDRQENIRDASRLPPWTHQMKVVSSEPQVMGATHQPNTEKVLYDTQRQAFEGVEPASDPLPHKLLSHLKAELQQEDALWSITVGGVHGVFPQDSECVRMFFSELSIWEKLQPVSQPQFLVLAPLASLQCMHDLYDNTQNSALVTLLTTEAVDMVTQLFSEQFVVVVDGDKPLPTSNAELKSPLSFVEVEGSHRRLSGEPVNTSLYQIYGWTAVLMALAGLAAVMSLTHMTLKKDPLLYAKFRPEIESRH